MFKRLKPPHLIENGTTTTFQMLKLRNVIVFGKLNAYFEFDASNKTIEKLWNAGGISHN